MPKDTYYFAHDYTASNNPKISAMINDYKAEGYGLYWYIIELLHQNENHKLQLKKHIYSAIAKQMLTSVEQVSKFINDCIEDYELLYLEDGFIFSDRVNKNIEKRAEISEKRSFAGRQSQIKRATSVEQMLTSVQQNSTKEKKGKETTLKSRDFVPPFLSEVLAYFDEKGYSEASANTAFNYYSASNWIDSKGNSVKNWKQKMISVWFKPENLKAEAVYNTAKTKVIDHRQSGKKW